MPLLAIKEKSVNDAWQVALARVLKHGDDIKTEYDDPDDLPSKDATVAIEVTEPFEHPMKMRGKAIKISSNCANNQWEVYGCGADTYLVGSIQSNYIEEIINGINDDNLHTSEKSYPYSYHDRIFRWRPYALEDVQRAHYDLRGYNMQKVLHHEKLDFLEGDTDSAVWKMREDYLVQVYNEDDIFGLSCDVPYSHQENYTIPIEIVDFPTVNQTEYIAKKLAVRPYSRRCQFITWRPYSDPYSEDPPCLQRGHFRVVDGKLRMQAMWRSRDLFRAWEANVNGMLYIQKTVLDMINDIREENGDEPYGLGSYTDFSNSLHIYGESLGELLDLMERMQKRGAIHPELEERIEPLRQLLKT